MHVLLPVDGSEQATEACAFVTERFPDAELTLLHVINPVEAGYSVQASMPTYSEEWYERQQDRAEGVLEEMAGTLEGDRQLHKVTEVGKPTNTIVRYAEDHDIDQIVMGSHGRSGVTRILLGSVAETVIRRSPVPVTVVR